MIKLAIAEDDYILNQMYRMKFETAGYEVDACFDGKTALVMVEEFRPDILLLDLQMPQMTGDEALRILRTKPYGRNLPVIILTNIGEEEAPPILKDLDVATYIVKADLTPTQVVERVREVLAAQKKKK